MANAYTSATFGNHYEYRQRRISYPFRNDPSLGFVVTRYLEGLKSSYSAPVLNTVDAEFSTAYLVAVKDIDHRDGELMKYEVEYASIPTTRDDYDGASVRFPGLGTATTANAAKTVVGFTPSTDRQSAWLDVPAHGYAVNSVIGYHLVITVGEDLLTLDAHALITGVTANSFQANIATPIPVGTSVGFFAGSVRNFSAAFAARNALTDSVRVRVRCDYFLPGITTGITTDKDIIVPPSLRVFTSAGAETETTSTTTMPTQAEYEAMVVGRQEFIAQATSDRWKGNIHERKITFARAI